MADSLKLLAVFLVVACFIYSGHAQCSLSNIMVIQTPMRKFVGGKPEFEVTIKSMCPCIQSNVKLNINGFRTTEPVNPSILDKDGFVNDKLPLPMEGVKFKYAADNMFPFRPISSQVSCS